jgi:hypothetical protein
MGCCISIEGLDHSQVHSAIVLQSIGENSRYHGTTERNRLQVDLSFISLFLIIYYYYLLIDFR